MRSSLVTRIASSLFALALLLSATLSTAASEEVAVKLGDPTTLVPGDILLMRNYRDAWSRMSYWTHNGMYIGAYGSCQHAVVEAVTPRVTASCLDDRQSHWFYRQSYGRSVVRVNSSTAAGPAVAYAKSKIGTPYDYFLSRRSDSALYCSELVWKAYLKGNVNVEYYAGNYVTPDDERFDADVTKKAEVCTVDGSTTPKTCPTKPLGRY